MPCPHNEITIVQRSQRQSAVAAAAYQSGEKLFCEYDQQVKHYPEKRGIVHNEILLPPNAPPEYADRNILWNAVEAMEKQWNSQLARRMGVMDGKVSNHAFGNKLLLAELPDKDSVLVGRYLSGDGKHPPPCKLGVPLLLHRFGGVP
jgi:hypothetical protein